MKVIATAIGYDGLTIRNPGDEFEMPDGSTGSWFKKADDDTKGPAKPERAKKGDKPDSIA